MFRLLSLVILASGVHAAHGADEESAPPQVAFKTNMGSFTIELRPERAPLSVANFLAYVQEGYYDGTIFHRVVPGFVAQGGGFTRSYDKKETREAIKNEADNGLSNKRGTIAMARTGFPDSATSQFYINLADNPALDHVNKSDGRSWGYAVFGEVVAGMRTVEAIAALETGRAGPFPSAVPLQTVLIESARLVEPQEPASEP